MHYSEAKNTELEGKYYLVLPFNLLSSELVPQTLVADIPATKAIIT